jgi:hypothetical protein
MDTGCPLWVVSCLTPCNNESGCFEAASRHSDLEDINDLEGAD